MATMKFGKKEGEKGVENGGGFRDRHGGEEIGVLFLRGSFGMPLGCLRDGQVENEA